MHEINEIKSTMQTDAPRPCLKISFSNFYKFWGNIGQQPLIRFPKIFFEVTSRNEACYCHKKNNKEYTE